MAREPLFDVNDPQGAWDELRSSRAFPAIVGGLAGAAISVAVMFVANRMSQPKKTLPAAYDTEGNPMNVVYLPAPPQPRILGFTLGDLFTLGMTGLTMFRQVQGLRAGNETDASQEQPPSSFPLPPSPGDKPKASHRK